MKKHYDRYDHEEGVLDHGDARGGSAGQVYKAFAATGKSGTRPGTIMYALGQCHHSVAVQNIRSDRPSCSSCSATSASAAAASTPCAASPTCRGPPTTPCCSALPARLPGKRSQVLRGRRWSSYIAGTTPQSPANPQSLNWMSNTGKYATSLMRAFYPQGGTPEGTALVTTICRSSTTGRTPRS